MPKSPTIRCDACQTDRLPNSVETRVVDGPTAVTICIVPGPCISRAKHSGIWAGR